MAPKSPKEIIEEMVNVDDAELAEELALEAAGDPRSTPVMRHVVKHWPPYRCYRTVSRPDVHVVIIGYATDGYLKVLSSIDSPTMGAAIDEMPPHDVVPCGCRAFRAPTEEESRKARANQLAIARAIHSSNRNKKDPNAN